MKPIREREFPVPAHEFPVLAKKFPVLSVSGNWPYNVLKLRTNSGFSRMLREFADNALKWLRESAPQAPSQSKIRKIPC
jgi:hypothetical protein